MDSASPSWHGREAQPMAAITGAYYMTVITCFDSGSEYQLPLFKMHIRFGGLSFLGENAFGMNINVVDSFPLYQYFE